MANICFLIRADNNSIKDKPPEVYIDEMGSASRDRYLSEALCEYADRNLRFHTFVKARRDRLMAYADELCGITA